MSSPFARHGLRYRLSRFFLPWALAATLLAAGVAAAPASPPSASGQAVLLEGELVVQVEDYVNQTSRIRHFLKTDSGRRYELRFKSRPPRHGPGSRVRVRGVASGDLVVLDSGGGTSLELTAAAPLPSYLGDLKLLVLLVNFQDNTAQPFTLADANNRVFTQASNFIRENTFQQAWLSGVVRGWYTLPVATTCSTSVINSYARQAATAAGIDLSAYPRVMYVTPYNNICGYAGVTSSGSGWANINLNGTLDTRFVGHEFGHALGLLHSHGLECGTAAIGASCTVGAYSDVADVMGNTGPGHFNAFQKERMGWLNNVGVPPITLVQSNGSYAIDAYESNTANPKALKILKSTDPTTGRRTWYYVEYRAGLGYDAYLLGLNRSNFASGVVIHTGTESDADSSLLIDLTPNSDVYYDWYDPALAVGRSFTDSLAGITVTPTSVDGTHANVNVTFGSSGCTRANPSVVISPSQSQSVAAGTAVIYTVAVTNNDNAGCSMSTFALQPGVPSGWTGTFASPSLSIGAGSAGSTLFTVTSPPTAGAGRYGVSAKAVDAADASHAGSGSAIYDIAAGTAAALGATIATDKATYSPGSTVTMTATITAGGTAVANATVNFTVVRPDGVKLTQSAATDSNGKAVSFLKLNRRRDPLGLYQVSGSAASDGQTATAATAFTVR